MQTLPIRVYAFRGERLLSTMPATRRIRATRKDGNSGYCWGWGGDPMTITDVASRLTKAKKTGNGFTALCPVHDDKSPSLSISEGNYRIVLHCFAGCSEESILDEIGVQKVDLFPDKYNSPILPINGNGSKTVTHVPKTKKLIECAYTYTDAQGEVLYEHVRYQPKGFAWRRPDGGGGHIYNLNNVERVPYKLPELTMALNSGIDEVWYGEGEGDTDNLRSLGSTASNFQCWTQTFNEYIKDTHAVLFRDHDVSGVKQANTAARIISEVAKSVKVIDLFDHEPLAESHGKDVSDWIEEKKAGGMELTAIAEELACIVSRAPDWTPDAIPEAEKTNDGSQAVPIPDLLPVPILYPELIPAPLRTWLTDISDRRGCPLEYPTIAALVGLGAVIGTKVGIRPKRYDDWRVFPNLWGLSIGGSGSLKTDATNDGLRPLEEIEKAEAIAYNSKLPKIEAEAFDRKIEIEAIASQLKAIHGGKPKGPAGMADREALKSRLAELQSLKPETPRRLMVNDSTVEKIGVLLNANPNGITSVQDEIAPFLDALDGKERQNDLKFYLKAANGTGVELVDRISRDSLLIHNLCLSMIGGTQPSRISALVDRTAEKSGDNGLLPRFTLMVYPDMPATYRYVDSEPKDIDQVCSIYKGIYEMQPGGNPFKILTSEAGGGVFLNFDPQAQEYFVDWIIKFENEMRGFGTFGTDIPGSHLQKLKGTMPKLALIFQIVDWQCGIDTAATGVTIKNAQLAVKWVEFLQSHARRIYATSTRPEFRGAKLILAKHEKGDLPDVVTARMVYRKHWRGLSTPKEVNEAIEVLVDHNWLRPLSQKENTNGRTSDKFVFNVSHL